MAYEMNAKKRKYIENPEFSGNKRFNDRSIERIDIENKIKELVKRNIEKSEYISLIEDIVKEAKNELNNRKSKIISTMIELFSKEISNINTYTIICGLLNKEENEFGVDLIESLSITLQEAIEEEKYDMILALMISITELVRVNVVQEISYVNFVESLLVIGENTKCPIYCVWILKSVILVLLRICDKLYNNTLCREYLINIVDRISTIVESRKKDYIKAIRIWLGSSNLLQIEELDRLYGCLFELKCDKFNKKITFHYYDSFKNILDHCNSHKLLSIKFNAHATCSKLPLPYMTFKLFSTDECISTHTFGKFIPDFLSYERIYLSRYVIDTIKEIHDTKQILNQLDWLIKDKRFNSLYIIVESILNYIIVTPDNLGLNVKFYNVLSLLTYTYFASLSNVVIHAVKNLYESLQSSMNICYFDRFISWFVIYLNNTKCKFDFDSLVINDNKSHPQFVFIYEVVRRLILMFDVNKSTPLMNMIKQIDLSTETNYIYQELNENETEVCRVLVNSIQQRMQEDEIIIKIEEALKEFPVENEILIIFQALLKGGSKSITHTYNVIDKYEVLLKHFINTSSKSELVIDVVYHFWQNNQTMLNQILLKLFHIGIISNHSIVTKFILYPTNSNICQNLINWGVVSKQLCLAHNAYLLLACNNIKFQQDNTARNEGDNLLINGSNMNDEDNTRDEGDDTRDDNNILDEADNTRAEDNRNENSNIHVEKKENEEMIDIKLNDRLSLINTIIKCIGRDIIKYQNEHSDENLNTLSFIYKLQRFQQVLIENYDILFDRKMELDHIIEEFLSNQHISEIIRRYYAFIN